MWITRVSIKNPVFATMVMVGIVVLGLFSYARLRVEQMPDVTLPFVQHRHRLSGRLARSRSKPTSASRSNTRSTRCRASSGSVRTRARGRARCSSSSGWAPTSRARCRTCATRSRWCGRAFPATSRIRWSSASTSRTTSPTVSLAVLSPTVEPARADLAHRSDDRQGAREHPGRGAGRRQRPRDAADPHPDQAVGARRRSASASTR